MKEAAIWRIVHSNVEMSLLHVKFKLRPRGGAAPPMAEMAYLGAREEHPLQLHLLKMRLFQAVM